MQSSFEAERQRQYYDHKANAISLEPGDLVLVKADAYKGRRKIEWTRCATTVLEEPTQKMSENEKTA